MKKTSLLLDKWLNSDLSHSSYSSDYYEHFLQLRDILGNHCAAEKSLETELLGAIKKEFIRLVTMWGNLSFGVSVHDLFLILDYTFYIFKNEEHLDIQFFNQLLSSRVQLTPILQRYEENLDLKLELTLAQAIALCHSTQGLHFSSELNLKLEPLDIFSIIYRHPTMKDDIVLHQHTIGHAMSLESFYLSNSYTPNPRFFAAITHRREQIIPYALTTCPNNVQFIKDLIASYQLTSPMQIGQIKNFINDQRNLLLESAHNSGPKTAAHWSESNLALLESFIEPYVQKYQLENAIEVANILPLYPASCKI